MPFSWQLWDRIRAFARKANIHRVDNVYQDQSVLDRIVSGGNFIDFSKQSALLEQTNLQINRLERYKDYDMMDEVGEVSLALDMYADESSLIDPERKHSIIVRAKSKRIKKIIEDLLYNTLLMDREVRPIIRYLCKFGDFAAEIIPTKNRDGVASFRFINVYNFTRIQTKFGDLVGFYYQDPAAGMPMFMHPWQVMHLRLTSYETIYHPYGRSLLDGARKDFKRLRLMEDAALIYRITRAPEKRIFSIPVGNIPPQQVPQYMELIARQMKKFKFVDPATGQVNERYSPLIQEDDFWLPKRADGTGPTVDTLPGAENLDAIADIEYFKKKMISALKIPFNRVGIGDPAEADGKSLASVSPEFAKAIQWVQREVMLGIKKIVIAHLAMRGHSLDEIKGFDLAMTAASAIDELYRIETWNTRADIIANLKETGMFSDNFILRRFTDMTDDEIDEMRDEQQEANRVQPAILPPGQMPAAGAGGEAAEDVVKTRKLILDDLGDPEVRKVLQEAEKLMSEARDARKLRIAEDNEPDFGPSPEYYVNQRDLDGLPGPNTDGKESLLVELSISDEERNQVKAETEDLLLGGNGQISEISDIADAIDEVQKSATKLIAEEETNRKE